MFAVENVNKKRLPQDSFEKFSGEEKNSTSR